MDTNLVANVKTSIAASRREVWRALVTPAAIKHYMFGAEVDSDWYKGSDITWKGELAGKPYEDKGVILRFEHYRMLQYTHFSPLSGKPDQPENYHTISIYLAGTGEHTDISLYQDNNSGAKARRESEENWGIMLESLKNYLEMPSRKAA